MKLSIALIASTVYARMKETEVQDAYFAGEDIILSNPAARSNKQWHDCGEAPPLPDNARAVKCSDDKCAAVCPIGWRSQGRWTIKCKADNTWAHSKFSPCVTCPSMSDQLDKVVEAESGVSFQEIMHKKQNLPWTQFFCGADTKSLIIKDKLFKKGSAKRNVKCICKNGRNGDPAWKKSCDWEFRGKPWSPSDVNDVQCKMKTNDKKKCDHPAPMPGAPPPYWTVREFQKCSGKMDRNGSFVHCQPAEIPEDCPEDSWEKLYGECGVADMLPVCDSNKNCDERRRPINVGGLTKKPYMSVPDYKKCAQQYREPLGVMRFWCEPAFMPWDCPVDSWNQLFGECGVADFKLC